MSPCEFPRLSADNLVDDLMGAVSTKALRQAFRGIAKKTQETRQNAGDDRSGMRDKMKTIREERLTKLKEVLTKEQYDKFIAQEEEMRNNRGQRKGQGGSSSK